MNEFSYKVFMKKLKELEFDVIDIKERFDPVAVNNVVYLKFKHNGFILYTGYFCDSIANTEFASLLESINDCIELFDKATLGRLEMSEFIEQHIVGKIDYDSGKFCTLDYEGFDSYVEEHCNSYDRVEQFLKDTETEDLSDLIATPVKD